MRTIIFFKIFLFFFLTSFAMPPKIIIKFDDLSALNGNYTGKIAMDYLINKKVKFSYGVIANQLDNTSLITLKPYLNATDDNENKLLEIWNHGLDHTCTEFANITSYTSQKTHFDNATQLVNKYLGIQMHTFGSPCNANGEITDRIINEDISYNVFFLANVAKISPTRILYLNWPRVEIENGIGNPEYEFFVKNYNLNIRYSPKYMILQGHPNGWTTLQFEQFKLIIDFLIDKGSEFVLPNDYYSSFNLFPPTNLVAKAVTPYKVNLSWNDNSTTEYNYKIERSGDGINWITIGTCPKNSTSYFDDNIYSISGFYNYRVYSNCGIKSEFSNISVVTNLNAKPIQYTLNISVFPNPSEYKITIKWSQAKSGFVSCYIYDINGKWKRTAFQGQYSSGEYYFPLDVSDLNSGTYFCLLNTQFGNLTTKILVFDN